MRVYLMSVALFLLWGCQSGASAPTAIAPLATTQEHIKQHPTGCNGPQCAEVNIEYEYFVGLPHASAYIETQLLKQAYTQPGKLLPNTLKAYAQQFLTEAKPGWASYLQSKVLDQHDALAVVELTSYTITGGANGEAGLAYLHYDRDTRKWLSLQDMLQPGEEEAFWQQVKLAYQAWLTSQGIAADSDFAKTWPFSRTANVAFLRSQVLLRYPVGQLGPNSMGHVRLVLSYEQLKGIVKPQFMPRRG